MCIAIKKDNFHGKDVKRFQNISYTIKKFFKQIFKQKLIERHEIDEDSVNKDQIEFTRFEHQQSSTLSPDYSLEDLENTANENLLNNLTSNLTVKDALWPIEFIRTEAGVFIWSTTATLLVDSYLIEPLNCLTLHEIAIQQIKSALP